MTTNDPIPWELLARYVAGECSPQEAAELSERIEQEPAVAAAFADLLLQAVAVRDGAATSASRKAAVSSVEKPRRTRGLILSAAALVLLAGLTWLVADRSESGVLTIVDLNGSVRWTGAGGEVRESLVIQDRLPFGLFETVSDDSTLALAFPDGSMITLLGGSAAAISGAGQMTVHLRSGSLSADVRPQPKEAPLIIHTPTARLEVIGTRFEVDSDTANTRLSVSEGRVRMTRLADGRVAEVPARHEAVASLGGEDFPVEPRKDPEVLWRSDFAEGPAGTQGRWLPAGKDRKVRVAAEPVFLPKSSRGPATIFRVGVTLPWQERANVQVRPDSRLRLSGNAAQAATLEVMLASMKPSGGYAGNWFHQRDVPAGPWQIELPVGAFRHWHAQTGDPPRETLELRQIAIYTINQDAGLEIESVEALGH